VVAGAWLKRKIWVLDWLNIPASVLGGFVYAAIALLLRDRYLNLEFDLVLRDILMIAFFTTVGLRASLRLVREGGVQVLQFWLAASLGVLLENVLGVGLAIVLGIPPLAGLICGSVTMAEVPGRRWPSARPSSSSVLPAPPISGSQRPCSGSWLEGCLPDLQAVA
jgi:ESS family glutamate:Na+ symporter